jgi:protein-tyrosine-phosphatase
LDTFAIAFVCTGNRFRSPLAEAFVKRLTAGLPVSVTSYGTLPREDSPPEPEASEFALACGVSLSDHRSRSLDNASLRHVDLLLGFEPPHVHHAVVDAEAPRNVSFTLGDFVSLLGSARPDAADENVVERARSLVRSAGVIAANSETSRPKIVRDPYGGPWEAYRRSATEIRSLCIALAEQLFDLRTTGVLGPVPAEASRPRKLFRR